MRAAIGVLVLAGGVARADAPASVNLLTAVPTVVAVSSTVDNRAILPEHMVDGNLETAWNSRTNELAGAWVGARIPADAHVEKIRLTVGFTKVDKKLGDLFTMNPRIKRVRVTRDGRPIAERDLDPESRALQDIPIDGPGGDYRVEVIDFLAGSKKTWREIGVSELEVWGTPPKGAVVKKVAPVVRVGSFDQRAPTQAECVKALPASEDKVVGFEAVEISDDLAICRLDRQHSYDTDAATMIAAVKRGTRLAMIKALPDVTVYTHGDESQGGGEDATVTLSAFPLTAKETALLVEEGIHGAGPMYDTGKFTSTLYRVSAAGFTKVLSFESSWSSGEAGNADRCTLTAVDTPLPAGIPDLAVACEKTHSAYPGSPEDFDWSKTRTERYRWKGGVYVKRS